MVGHYPTNKLIGREHIPHRKNFPHPNMHQGVISGIRPRFRSLSRSEGQITHVLLTRSPLVYPRKGLTARLACVKHAASVRPEPGSNSPLKTLIDHPAETEQPMKTREPNPAIKLTPAHKNVLTKTDPPPTGRRRRTGTKNNWH